MRLKTISRWLGHWSDRVTVGVLRRNTEALPRLDVSDHVMARIRHAQLQAVLSLSGVMMFANVASAIALVTLDAAGMGWRAGPVIWAASLTLLAAIAYRRSRIDPRPDTKIRGRRAPGAVVFSSILLCLFWAYPPLFMLPGAPLYMAGCLAAVSAGMVAGGALALYPVPLAAAIYTTATMGFGLVALVYSGHPLTYYYLAIGLSFQIVVWRAISNHAVLFLRELLRKEEARAQRDVIGLLLGDVEESAAMWLWRADADLSMTEISPGLLEIAGLDREAALGLPLRTFLARCGAVPVGTGDAETLAALCALPEDLPSQTDLKVRLAPQGEAPRVLTVFCRKTIGASGRLVGFDGFVRDVTDEHVSRERARYLATHDPMTGLLNGATFQAEARRRLAAFNAGPDDGRRVIFLFADADNLKSVNDTYGHSAGDGLIRTIATRLAGLTSASGLAARKGGDEFVACIFDLPEAEISDFTEALRNALCRDFEVEGVAVELSCSIGVARAAPGSADLARLEREADRALYYAKGRGRGLIEHYNDEFGEALARERRIAADLPAAIRTGLLDFEFQPIVRAEDGSIFACEALLRWDHVFLGPVAPDAILHAARQTHTTRALTDAALRAALDAAAEWPEDVLVTVNVMARELTEPDCYERVSGIVAASGVAPGRLCIEITESELLENSEAVRRNLTRLRRSGIRIFVDDFGAGYSSLNYLPQYPSDAIKIDRSLVINSARSTAGPMILHAVASMASALSVPAVAEGVETESELESALRAGFEYVQGYHFHRPMRQAELLALFARPPVPPALAAKARRGAGGGGGGKGPAPPRKGANRAAQPSGATGTRARRAR